MTPVAEIQKWFGRQISQPLGRAVCDLADTWIAPSSSLRPKERVVIYREQYWWRLLSTLQSNFPMVTRLFGHTAFNAQIAVPYLSEFPPTHWALCKLGETLPEWVEKHYPGEDKPLIATAARLDWAAQRAFWTEESPSIDFEAFSEEERLLLPLKLQPHVHLFTLDADLLSFRDAFLAEDIDHWSSHPFPRTDYRRCYFAIFRDTHNNVTWRELAFGEYTLLSYFQAGTTIQQACSQIASLALDDVASLLPLWFRAWTSQSWFTHS